MDGYIVTYLRMLTSSVSTGSPARAKVEVAKLPKYVTAEIEAIALAEE
jgi:enamine deaminase RidA (YjgF/YER057c/UK114 family)